MTNGKLPRRGHGGFWFERKGNLAVTVKTEGAVAVGCSDLLGARLIYSMLASH